MFGSNTLDIAIGLAFLFFILSLVVTATREMIEGWMQARASLLERGLRELLRDPAGTGLTQDFYDHPLINSLFRGTYDPGRLTNRNGLTRWLTGDLWKKYRRGSSLPAYIPARNFALALLDLSARGAAGAGNAGPAAATFQQVRAGVVAHIGNADVQRAVLLALDSAKGDLEQARANLEAWFDSGMDRVSGWYRRHTQWIVFWLGVALAVGLNVDTIRITRALYENAALREVIVAEAQATVQRAQPTGTTNSTTNSGGVAVSSAVSGCSELVTAQALARGESCAQHRLEGLGYPVGWSGYQIHWPRRDGTWWEKSAFPWPSVPGWLLTALALTLGAPFWFDVLNKIMVIRSTVKPHEKSPEESSEDRQSGGASRPPNQVRPLQQEPPVQRAPPAEADADDPEFVPHTWTGREDATEGDL